MKEISILLPDKIYVKKMKENQGIVTMPEEYNIYFSNIIQPYNSSWDVYIKCEYGQNLGHCWRLTNFCEDVAEFDFELVIYNEYGEKLASKKSKIIPVKKKENLRTRVMFFGDSMTHSAVYVNHIVNTLKGIDSVGVRSFNGHTYVEGRGGWRYDTYFERWYDEFGMCPFLFPKGVSGKDYYGDKDFIDMARAEGSETYVYYGYDYDELKDGQYFASGRKLYKKNGNADELISENPEFEFDFAKYLERFGLEKPEIFSVLLGANDLQIVPYEESDEQIAKYISNAKQLINEIHRYDRDIKIIINLPILGAEQYAWGLSQGCRGNEKQYRFNIMRATGELIKHFDNKENENIYLAPMIACIDPEHGFPYTCVKANKYSEEMVKTQNNWVHPNYSGYCQMGDALAGVIEYIR